MTDVKIRSKPLFQAMVEGIQQEMERDPRVICMGEDVGQDGRRLPVHRGAAQEVSGSRHRYADLGDRHHGRRARRAASGLRPIAELMFVDFMGVCFGQIMNEIGKATYMSGGAVRLPLVITASTGGGFSDAAQHSADAARPVRARAGAQSRGAVEPLRCKGLDDHGDPRRQPCRVSCSTRPCSGCPCRLRRRQHRRQRPGRAVHGAVRQGPHRFVKAPTLRLSASRRRFRRPPSPPICSRPRHLRRGDRPADAGAARCRSHRRIRAEDRTPASSSTRTTSTSA